MPPVGFEPTISAGERPQTYTLDRAATGTGIYKVRFLNNKKLGLSISSEKNYCTDLCISSATSKSGTNVLIMLASLIRPIRSKLL